jgi:hypothetical protein
MVALLLVPVVIELVTRGVVCRCAIEGGTYILWCILADAEMLALAWLPYIIRTILFGAIEPAPLPPEQERYVPKRQRQSTEESEGWFRRNIPTWMSERGPHRLTADGAKGELLLQQVLSEGKKGVRETTQQEVGHEHETYHYYLHDRCFDQPGGSLGLRFETDCNRQLFRKVLDQFKLGFLALNGEGMQCCSIGSRRTGKVQIEGYSVVDDRGRSGSITQCPDPGYANVYRTTGPTHFAPTLGTRY